MNIKQFVFNPFQENTYLVYNDSLEAMIIDPGCNNTAEENKIASFIKDNNLTIKYVINTHLHIDHVLGNYYFEVTFGVKALAHQGDEFWLNGLSAQARMFGLDLKSGNPTLGGFLKEGDKLKLGDDVFDIFETPGHSPGSIVLYNASSGLLFAGDLIFQGSIGRTDLAGGNYQDIIKSIQQKILVLPDETVVYSGHGPSTTIGHEKQYNPYF
jgi:glyoxylase-like metal-dependent hydrolase (beta-lactamase superfamily II)